MAGKLEKMLILAYETSVAAEDGGQSDAKDKFEALINPETYTLDYKVKTANEQGQGTSSKQLKFEYAMPEELSFEFLFDNTGIIDGKPKKEGIFDDVNHFRQMLIGYQGSSHEPYHLKLVWGNLIFKGRAIELGITYKLFDPNGQPIRAIAKVKFKGSIEEKKTYRQRGQNITRSNPFTNSKIGRYFTVNVLPDLRRSPILFASSGSQ